MADKKPVKPNTQELAQADHGMGMSAKYLNMLIENPDSVLVQRGRNYQIYDELLRDDQVKSCFQQRRTSLTSATWNVEPASESAVDKAAAEFIQQQLEHVGWDDKTDKMLYGVFYGFAVAEAMWEMQGTQVGLADIKVRNRSRFKFNMENKLALVDTEHPQGLVLPERKFWTYSAGASHDDNPYGQGLAHSLYWPVFFKRSDIKFWLIFLEKFGMPTTTIRLPSGQMENPKEISRAREVIAAIQADSGVVIPDNMVVELIEAARSGTADYDGLVSRMDGAISKVILSQTMTTDNGSSRSQAEVHEGVADAVVDSDADMIADSFRRTIGTWLTEWNFPGATPPFIVRNTEPEEDLSVRAERDGKIFALGYEPTEDYIEETYGPGWRKKAEPVQIPGEVLSTGTGPLPAEFAEVNALLQRRAGHRVDQQTLADAAEMLATNYKGVYGKRVEQLLSYLEESDDIDTFKRQLTGMLEDTPPEETVEAFQRATLFSRLMGMFRSQRD